MFYLAEVDWSPRFEENFFTVRPIHSRTSHRHGPHDAAATKSENDGHDDDTKMSAAETLQSTATAVNGNENHEYNPDNDETSQYSFSSPPSSPYPAVFYNIQVCCAHQERIIPRRYSQFRQLYDILRSDPPPPPPSSGNNGNRSNDNDEFSSIHFPPKSCNFLFLHNNRIRWGKHPPNTNENENEKDGTRVEDQEEQEDAEFLNVRMEELSDFLLRVLQLPGYAQHPAMVAFLQLNHFEM